MNKEEGSKTVVVGGKKDVTQQYCGTVGGQSSDFSTMDTEVKVRAITFGRREPEHLLNVQNFPLALQPTILCLPC